MIEEDGSIDRGAQNLPGNWESSKFNLPARAARGDPEDRRPRHRVLMHNDAVVQGLSEVPFMQDVKHWGVLTSAPGSATRASPIGAMRISALRSIGFDTPAV